MELPTDVSLAAGTIPSRSQTSMRRLKPDRACKFEAEGAGRLTVITGINDRMAVAVATSNPEDIMGFATHKTWAGVGIKGGGFLGIAGADTFEGTAFRLDNTPRHSLHEINITSIRAGLGLGGGVGVSLFFAFNVNTLWEINDKKMQDWGVNISLPGAKIGIGKWSYPILKNLTTGAKLLKNFDAKRLADMRTLASLFYSVMYDVGGGLNGNQWAAVVIDVPEAGWAAELSAYASWGEIRIGDPFS